MTPPASTENDPRSRDGEFTADPPSPEGSSPPDEEAAARSRRTLTKALAAGRTRGEDHRLHEGLGVDPTEAHELLAKFVDRYPEMARWFREPVIHELKTWTRFFDAVADGRKTFELRKDDRGFKVGDVLRLRDYDPVEGAYTGGQIDVVVTYVTDASPLDCLAPGYVCMGIKRVP